MTTSPSPILSIIVPIYNVEPYLRACLDSILNQTFKDYELILIDDGSPDGSGAICDEYAAVDSRIIVIHQKNGGLSSARNSGLDRARGAYITFVDSDDQLRGEDTYEANIHILQQDPSIDALQFPMEIMEFNGETTSEEYPDRYIRDRDELFRIWSQVFGQVNAVVWNKIFKASLFREIRFPQGRWYEDAYLAPAFINAIQCFFVSGKGCYRYFRRGESISHSEFSPRKRLHFLEAHLQIVKEFIMYDGVDREKIAILKRMLRIYLHTLGFVPESELLYIKRAIRHLMPGAFSLVSHMGLFCTDVYKILFIKLLGLTFYERVWLYVRKRRHHDH